MFDRTDEEILTGLKDQVYSWEHHKLPTTDQYQNVKDKFFSPFELKILEIDNKNRPSEHDISRKQANAQNPYLNRAFREEEIIRDELMRLNPSASLPDLPPADLRT